jgi:hypothetical protein
MARIIYSRLRRITLADGVERIYPKAIYMRGILPINSMKILILFVGIVVGG